MSNLLSHYNPYNSLLHDQTDEAVELHERKICLLNPSNIKFGM